MHYTEYGILMSSFPTRLVSLTSFPLSQYIYSRIALSVYVSVYETVSIKQINILLSSSTLILLYDILRVLVIQRFERTGLHLAYSSHHFDISAYQWLRKKCQDLN